MHMYIHTCVCVRSHTYTHKEHIVIQFINKQNNVLNKYLGETETGNTQMVREKLLT